MILSSRAVFLDRDNTLNPDPHGYISRPEDFTLFPITGPALKLLQDAGFRLIILTNQSGIARGLFSFADLELVHDKMRKELAAFGVVLTDIYVCPHHPDFPEARAASACTCRKPLPGMALRALREHRLDPAQCYMIGDKPADIAMAIAARVRAIRVGSGTASGYPDVPVVPDLLAAAHIILGQSTSG